MCLTTEGKARERREGEEEAECSLKCTTFITREQIIYRFRAVNCFFCRQSPFILIDD
jgi:hypothetical protein